VNVEIQRGELVAVVGVVGCGKTAFLRGLTGNMKIKRKQQDAYVYANKNLSYVE
jgi:ABC-type phosphate/phosphonate transport system ATPase subunit